MPADTKRLPLSLWRDSLILILGLVLCAGFFYNFHPNIIDASYSGELQPEEQPFTLPLRFTSEAQTIHARLIVHVGVLHASRFRINVDDCLEEVIVNNVSIEDPRLPYCDYAQPFNVNLSAFFSQGFNQIDVSVRNHGGPGKLDIQTSNMDPGLLTAWSILLLLCLWYLHRVFRHWALPWRTKVSWLVVIFGIVLRIAYVSATPHDMRGYDTDGHLEYVDFLLNEYRLPRIHEGGWEWYQPPLYYIALSPIVGIGRAMDVSHERVLFVIQTVSLVTSIVVLLLCVWMAQMLFESKKQWLSQTLFLAIIATFPSLIFFASRVNNDVFLHLFSFAALGCLLAWWKHPRFLPFLGASIAIGLAILSKSNALLLVPLLFGCLAVKPGIRLSRKFALGNLALLILFMLTGWYASLRLIVQKQEALIGNIGNLNSGLLLQNTFDHLTRFNVVDILAHPFNNPWSDEAGRQFFWEYLYRSALFGEFSFAPALTPLALAMLLLSFALLLIGIGGYAAALVRSARVHFPLLLTTVLVLAGHLLFRIRYPYSSSQDFRYSILFVVPAAFFIVYGMECFPKLRKITVPLVVLFVAACTGFIGMLSLH